MKQVVDQGQLGQIATATASISFIGTFQPDNWRCHRDTNPGGPMMQLGIHHIETLTYLLGPVVNTQGFFAHVAAPADVDDVGIAHLTFESGATGTIASTYVSPMVYEMHLYGDRANLDCVLDMLVWPDTPEVDKRASLTIHKPDAREAIPIAPKDALALQLDEFARSVRGEVKPETGADEGLTALAVVEAALRSSETGEPVDPRTLLENPNSLPDRGVA
jgi:predicted dehydrogenase